MALNCAGIARGGWHLVAVGLAHLGRRVLEDEAVGRAQKSDALPRRRRRVEQHGERYLFLKSKADSDRSTFAWDRVAGVDENAIALADS